MTRKILHISTLTITLFAVPINIDVMLNNGTLWNALLSVIVWLLWAIVLGDFLLHVRKKRKAVCWLMIILAVIMAANFFVFTKGVSESELAAILIPIVFPTVLPILGLSVGLANLGLNYLAALEIPYALFAVEILALSIKIKNKEK